MSYLGQHWAEIDLYVEHGIDEAELVTHLPLPEPEHVDDIEEDVEDDPGVGTQVDNDPGMVSQAENDQVQSSGGEFSDGEADLESNQEDGDSDLERSPLDEAGFVDVKCGNAENHDEEIRSARAEGDTENVDLGGEKDDVQSEYYDSEDPLSYQSEFEEFKKAMINYAVYSKRNIHFVRNERKRISLACDQPCPFQAHGSWDDTFKCFQLKTVTTEHKCNLKYSLRIVSQVWIEERHSSGMVQVNDLVKLDKQVQAGTVLNPEYFMIGATDKEEARKILRALKECNLLSLDDLSSSSVKLMNGIVQGITFNWVKYIFNKVCEFIVAAKLKDEPLIGDKFLHKVGYGLMIYEILRKKGMRLRKQNNVGDYRVFFRRFGPDYRKKESHSKLFEGGDSTSSKTPRSRRRNITTTSDASEFLASSNPLAGDQEVISTTMAIVPFEAVIEQPAKDVY
nr:uncharacterized protein LOC109164765 [Ipomoea batatas]